MSGSRWAMTRPRPASVAPCWPRTSSTSRSWRMPATTRSPCTACPRTRARRSPLRSSTARARPSGIRPRTDCTPRRRYWSSCFPPPGRVPLMKQLSIFGAAALLALAGCGGSNDSSSSSSSSTAASGGGGGQQLTLQADQSQLKFNTNKLPAKSGKVTITMTNPSGLQHNVALKGGVNEQGAVVGQGGKSVVTANLKPGKYTFYCAVDGHEAAGMNGELDVS